MYRCAAQHGVAGVIVDACLQRSAVRATGLSPTTSDKLAFFNSGPSDEDGVLRIRDRPMMDL